MPRIICPFCSNIHDFTLSNINHCPNNPNEIIPDTYIEEYNEVPPLWLVTVGFPKHGKTTFISVLTIVLEKIDKIWPTYYNALDGYTIQEIRRMRTQIKEAKTFNPTKFDGTGKKSLRPLLLSIYDLPENKSRCLVMYDLAGQVYENQDDTQNYTDILRRVNTVWFLVSLDNLKTNKEVKTITDLFTTYENSMKAKGIGLKGRNLIVVYTKADKINFLENNRKYTIVHQYRTSDPFEKLVQNNTDITRIKNLSFSDYKEQMQTISNHLKNYTYDCIDSGATFIRRAEKSEINLTFCITSALGHEPSSDGNLSREISPQRVLDPLLWAVILDEPKDKADTSLSLILDTSFEDKEVEGILSSISAYLADFYELSIYYLGQSSIISKPGQTFPNPLSTHPFPRLIGPILETIPDNTYSIIILNNPILDLVDFRYSIWQNHTLVVSLNSQYYPDWPHSFIYHQNDNPRILIDKLSYLLQEE